MSHPVSRYLHPFDVARHPALEPEVEHAILASWASDCNAVSDRSAPHKPAGAGDAGPAAGVRVAMKFRDLAERPGSRSS